MIEDGRSIRSLLDPDKRVNGACGECYGKRLSTA